MRDQPARFWHRVKYALLLIDKRSCSVVLLEFNAGRPMAMPRMLPSCLGVTSTKGCGSAYWAPRWPRVFGPRVSDHGPLQLVSQNHSGVASFGFYDWTSRRCPTLQQPLRWFEWRLSKVGQANPPRSVHNPTLIFVIADPAATATRAQTTGGVTRSSLTVLEWWAPVDCLNWTAWSLAQAIWFIVTGV